ncbi:MAG: hypothetical protein ABIJ96_17665 [Elusimicrobiota bacterium]
MMSRNCRVLLAVMGCAGLAALAATPGLGADEDDPVDPVRAQRRAFYTAPPVIPHEIADRGSETCLGCHENVTDLGDRVSIQTPHPEFSNCQQCHVRSAPPGERPAAVATNWRGLKEPRTGRRAHPKAPPAIPHRLFLREKCGVCHGAEQPNKNMRSPHPERSSCRQCHLSDPKTQF